MIDFLMEHKLTTLLGILLLVAGTWYGLNASMTPSSTSSLSTETPASGGVGGNTVNTLLALRTIKLEGAIFSEPAFATLQDFTMAIVPEPYGRPNPFAPLAKDVTQAAQNSSTDTMRNPALFAPKR